MTVPRADTPPLIAHANPGLAELLTRDLRRTQFVAVLATLATAVVLVLAFSDRGADALALLALPLGFVALFQVKIWETIVARRRQSQAGTRVLTLDASGLTSEFTPGAFTLPWEAISGITTTHKGAFTIATFVVVPGTTPETPGVSSALNPAEFRRVVSKGLLLGSAATNVPMDAILESAAGFTQGRLTVESERNAAN
ncbi:hypothetical protein [Demequina aurantiaca]|uniref:hypothetical protein n=1 Tax=Demequina aurantiaca TaxID=676200 RepID=UPI003D35173A